MQVVACSFTEYSLTADERPDQSAERSTLRSELTPPICSGRGTDSGSLGDPSYQGVPFPRPAQPENLQPRRQRDPRISQMRTSCGARDLRQPPENGGSASLEAEMTPAVQAFVKTLLDRSGGSKASGRTRTRTAPKTRCRPARSIRTPAAAVGRKSKRRCSSIGPIIMPGFRGLRWRVEWAGPPQGGAFAPAERRRLPVAVSSDNADGDRTCRQRTATPLPSVTAAVESHLLTSQPSCFPGCERYMAYIPYAEDLPKAVGFRASVGTLPRSLHNRNSHTDGLSTSRQHVNTLSGTQLDLRNVFQLLFLSAR